jgi:hypothetical protein
MTVSHDQASLITTAFAVFARLLRLLRLQPLLCAMVQTEQTNKHSGESPEISG